MSLALATVVYEWRRYMAAVVALAFSGLLVLAQVGMFVGIGKAFTATIDRSRADLFVLGPKADSLFGNSGLPRRVMSRVYLNPEVAEISDLEGDGAPFNNLSDKPRPGEKAKPGAARRREFVQIMAVDTAPGSLTLPTDIPEDVRRALQEPFVVAVDRSALGRLGVKLGDRAGLGTRTVRIGAILTTYPNVAQPLVLMSRETLRLMNMAESGTRVGPLMVRLRDPSKVEAVRDQLNAASRGEYRAWTRAELGRANGQMLMKNQILGIMLGFSAFLGLLIGIGITWQTLRGALLANIKEFASLRALGVSVMSLRIVVLELSFWVGVAGLGATALLLTGVKLLAQSGGVPMVFPLSNVISTAVFLLVIAMLSGLLSLGILKQSQPADLLR